MLTPANYKLEPMILGSIWDPAPMTVTVDETVKNLTGCLVVMPIYNQSGILVETLVDGDGLVLDRTGGVIAPIRSIAEALATYTAGVYSYHLDITEPDGLDKNRYLEGTLEVRA